MLAELGCTLEPHLPETLALWHYCSKYLKSEGGKLCCSCWADDGRRRAVKGRGVIKTTLPMTSRQFKREQNIVVRNWPTIPTK